MNGTPDIRWARGLALFFSILCSCGAPQARLVPQPELDTERRANGTPTNRQALRSSVKVREITDFGSVYEYVPRFSGGEVDFNSELRFVLDTAAQRRIGSRFVADSIIPLESVTDDGDRARRTLLVTSLTKYMAEQRAVSNEFRELLVAGVASGDSRMDAWIQRRSQNALNRRKVLGAAQQVILRQLESEGFNLGELDHRGNPTDATARDEFFQRANALVAGPDSFDVQAMTTLLESEAAKQLDVVRNLANAVESSKADRTTQLELRADLRRNEGQERLHIVNYDDGSYDPTPIKKRISFNISDEDRARIERELAVADQFAKLGNQLLDDATEDQLRGEMRAIGKTIKSDIKKLKGILDRLVTGLDQHWTKAKFTKLSAFLQGMAPHLSGEAKTNAAEAVRALADAESNLATLKSAVDKLLNLRALRDADELDTADLMVVYDRVKAVVESDFEEVLKRAASLFGYFELAEAALALKVPQAETALKGQQDALAALFGPDSDAGKLLAAIKSSQNGFSVLWKVVSDAVRAFAALRNQQRLADALAADKLNAGASFNSILRPVHSDTMPDGIIELAKTKAHRGDRIYATLRLADGQNKTLVEEPFSFSVVTRGIYNTAVTDVGYVDQVDAPSGGDASGHLSAGLGFMFHHHADGSNDFERFMNGFDPSLGFGARILNFTRQRDQSDDTSFETDPGIGAEARLGILGDTVSGVFGYEIGEGAYWGITIAPFKAWDFLSTRF